MTDERVFSESNLFGQLNQIQSDALKVRDQWLDGLTEKQLHMLMVSGPGARGRPNAPACVDQAVTVLQMAGAALHYREQNWEACAYFTGKANAAYEQMWAFIEEEESRRKTTPKSGPTAPMSENEKLRIRNLNELGWTQRDIAQEVGRSMKTVGNYLRSI